MLTRERVSLWRAEIGRPANRRGTRTLSLRGGHNSPIASNHQLANSRIH